MWDPICSPHIPPRQSDIMCKYIIRCGIATDPAETARHTSHNCYRPPMTETMDSVTNGRICQPPPAEWARIRPALAKSVGHRGLNLWIRLPLAKSVGHHCPNLWIRTPLTESVGHHWPNLSATTGQFIQFGNHWWNLLVLLIIFMFFIFCFTIREHKKKEKGNTQTRANTFEDNTEIIRVYRKRKRNITHTNKNASIKTKYEQTHHKQKNRKIAREIWNRMKSSKEQQAWERHIKKSKHGHKHEIVNSQIKQTGNGNITMIALLSIIYGNNKVIPTPTQHILMWFTEQESMWVRGIGYQWQPLRNTSGHSWHHQFKTFQEP